MFLLFVAVVGIAPSTIAAPAPAWCSVSPTQAAAFAPPLVARLARRLDDAPAPLAHVHTEHPLSGDPEREASLTAERDLPLMRDAALAWRAGAGDAYLHLAQRYLDAWTATYRPDLNPIDETNFDALIDTFALIQATMPSEQRAAMRRLLTAWAQGYIDEIDRAAASARRNETYRNNWQSHRIKLVTMAAAALDDPRLFGAARRLFRDQIAVNVGRDGEVIDFQMRDALHYVVYDLEPLLQAALAAKARGEDWYHPSKPGAASLEAAVAWLRPYAAGEKTHEEYVHSRVAFDAERARAGEKGFKGLFEPRAAAKVYWLAAEFDPKWRALAETLEPKAPTFLAMCGE